MWNACCTVHYMWRHTISVIYPVLFFLFIRGENRVNFSWNLKCEGNRGWVLYSGMTSGDLSGTDQGPGTDLSGTSEPLRSRMRSRSSSDLASPLHRWADISNYRSSMAFICFIWTVSWESLGFVMRRKFKLLETWQVLYESFFAWNSHYLFLNGQVLPLILCYHLFFKMFQCFMHEKKARLYWTQFHDTVPFNSCTLHFPFPRNYAWSSRINPSIAKGKVTDSLPEQNKQEVLIFKLNIQYLQFFCALYNVLSYGTYYFQVGCLAHIVCIFFYISFYIIILCCTPKTHLIKEVANDK